MSEEICPICHEEIDYYSFGECLHPSCVKCAIKLRKFHTSENTDYSKCPTCRRSLNRIYIMKSVVALEKVNLASFQTNQELDILFQTSAIHEYFKAQLECICSKCNAKFSTMSALNRHMFNEHSLSYCDLCMKYARLLPSEFVPMTKEELAKHKKYNSDLKRGHPKCQFCNNYYYEFEDLIKHIRDRHFICDICNYNSNIEVFSSQAELIDHYESQHFICLECRRENKITFFATSEELGSHCFSVHGSDSWLPVSIVMNSARDAPKRYEDPNRQPELVVEQNPEEWTPDDFPSLSDKKKGNNKKTKPATSSFPSPLSAVGLNQPVQQQLQQQKRAFSSMVGSQSAPITGQDFPSLAGTGNKAKKSSAPVNTWTGKVSVQQHNQQASAQPTLSNALNRFTVPQKGDFPTLNNETKKAAKKSKPLSTSQAILKTEFSELSLANRKQSTAPLSLAARRILESQMNNSKNLSNEKLKENQPNKKPKKAKKPVSILEDDELNHVETFRDTSINLSKRDLKKGIGFMNYESVSSSRPISSSIQVMDLNQGPSQDNVVISQSSETNKKNKKDKKNDFFDSLTQARFGDESSVKISSQGDFPTLSRPAQKSAQVDLKPIDLKKQPKKKPTKEEKEERIQLDCVDPEDIIYRNMNYFYVEKYSENNLNLIANFQDFLRAEGRTKSPFQKFSEISKSFLEGKMPSKAFMLTFISILPKDSADVAINKKISEMFSQMLSYLPNIARQRALYRVLKGGNIPYTGNKALDKEFNLRYSDKNDASLKQENMPIWISMALDCLSPCKTCKQIFLNEQYKSHIEHVHAREARS